MAEFTDEELAALYRALASGTLVVRTGNDEVRYGSFDDLRARIGFIEARRMAVTAPLPVAGRAGFRRT